MKDKGNKSLKIVIKLGTSSIVDEKTHQPLLSILSLIVETAVKLRNDGHKVIIVSSGAIGVGLRRMDLEKRPKHLPMIQALAAIGQCRLISLWDSLFSNLRQPIAQILLTRNDIADRTQYLNAQNTFTALLEMGVIPIVNENDTIAVTEIKFGDNDTLSAITSAMVHADYLFLMTDVECLYDKNPRTHPDAQPIEVVEDIAALQADVSSAGSALGTGGMSTKIVAARLATSAGVTTVITSSSKPGNIANIVTYCESLKDFSLIQAIPALSLSQPQSTPGTPASERITSIPGTPIPELLSTTTTIAGTATPSSTTESKTTLKAPLHTRFTASDQPIRDRHFWLLHGLAPHGTIYIDAGAHRALENKAGLLAVGVIDVVGSFAQQEAVRLVVVDRLPTASSSPIPTSPPGSPLVNSPHVSKRSSIINSSDPKSGVVVGTSGSSNAAKVKQYEGLGVEVGRALVNYSAVEIGRIKGVRSSEIQKILGYAESEYIALRENISFFVRESRPVTPSLEVELEL